MLWLLVMIAASLHLSTAENPLRMDQCVQRNLYACYGSDFNAQEHLLCGAVIGDCDQIRTALEAGADPRERGMQRWRGYYGKNTLDIIAQEKNWQCYEMVKQAIIVAQLNDQKK